MIKQKRNTKTKQLVKSILDSSSSALCYDDFERRIPEKMDKATIYRILQSFCEHGMAHKIMDDNGKTYYALCRHCSGEKHNDNHLHFRCIRCETISCIDEPVSIASLPTGYDMLSVSCTVSGYCPNCSGLQDEKRID